MHICFLANLTKPYISAISSEYALATVFETSTDLKQQLLKWYKVDVYYKTYLKFFGKSPEELS